MLTIQCTKKLNEKLKNSIEVTADNKLNPLYSWHANLFLFNRKNGVMLMNNQTFYNVVLFGVKKEHFTDFGQIVMKAIKDNFAVEGIADQVIERYFKNAGNIHYTKTHDRKILGQMNDMIFMTQCILEDYQYNGAVNILELNKTNNRSPMVKRRHHRAIDALKEELQALREFNFS